MATEHPEKTNTSEKETGKQDSGDTVDWKAKAETAEKRYRDEQGELTRLQQEKTANEKWAEENPDILEAINKIVAEPEFAKEVLGKESTPEQDDWGAADYLSPKAKAELSKIPGLEKKIAIMEKRETERDQRAFEVGKKLFQSDIETAKTKSEYSNVFSDEDWNAVAESHINAYIKEHPTADATVIVKFAGEKTKRLRDKVQAKDVKDKKEQGDKFPPEGGGTPVSPKLNEEKYTVRDGSAGKRALERLKREL